MTQLTVIENIVKPLQPRLEDILPPSLPFPRFKQLVMTNFERVPKLTGCTPESITSSVIGLSVLGLEPDGVTGQSYMLPFSKGGKLLAQPIVGYKGYQTLADRSGFTLDGILVRKGDEFEYRPAEVEHPIIHNPRDPFAVDKGEIMGAYAIAKHLGRPPRVFVMSISEIEEIKNRAPGGNSGYSPWNSPKDYPAMVRKTPMRVLGGQLPVRPLQIASTFEMHRDLGHDAEITIEGDVKVRTAEQVEPEIISPEQQTEQITREKNFRLEWSEGDIKKFTNADEWLGFFKKRLSQVPADRLAVFGKVQRKYINEARDIGAKDQADAADAALAERAKTDAAR